MRADVVQAIELVLRSSHPDLLVSVLKVVVNIAFTSDAVAAKVLTKDIFRRLKALCSNEHPEVSLHPYQDCQINAVEYNSFQGLMRVTPYVC